MIKYFCVEVKAHNFDGISYLEAKHLLRLNYCHSVVYFLRCKAEGLSIQGRPVVRSLVEIRLFLEKIRPIDRKLQYQIQKLTKTTTNSLEEMGSEDYRADENHKENLLKLQQIQRKARISRVAWSD